jgi:hypothetical protein
MSHDKEGVHICVDGTSYTSEYQMLGMRKFLDPNNTDLFFIIFISSL